MTSIHPIYLAASGGLRLAANQLTTPQWPMMNLVIPGVTRDQMMACHKANHIQGVYACTPAQAQAAMAAKCCCLQTLDIEVFECGGAAK